MIETEKIIEDSILNGLKQGSSEIDVIHGDPESHLTRRHADPRRYLTGGPACVGGNLEAAVRGRPLSDPIQRRP